MTGVNKEVDLIWVLIQLGIVLFFYFIIIPVSRIVFESFCFIVIGIESR